MHEGLAALRAAVLAHDPSLAGATFRLAEDGWESATVIVGEAWVFRFPGSPAAEEALGREAGLLAALRGRVSLPVPDLALVRTPRLFSRHRMIPGRSLLPADYDRLPEGRRERLAQDLARLMAELHALPVAAMREAGARPVRLPATPGEVAARALPLLPPGVRGRAEAALAAWAGLGPDPHGEAFGHFDLHGWNLAFDHEAGRLRGAFDFGGAGVGPVHLEFVQPAQAGRDLAVRLARAFGRLTGREVDLGRADVLTAAFRLGELAVHADEPDKAEPMLALVRNWLGAEGP